MATVAQLNVSIGASIAELQKGLKNAEKEMRRTGANLSRIGNDVSTSLSLPLALLGGSAIKAAGEFEGLRLAMRATFQTAGRSIEEADAEVNALRKSALAPGLDFEQAVKASIRLQAVGLSAEKSRTTIEQLANAIASTGGTAENLSSVTVQMAQMISKGKVLSQDLRIIQENLPIVSSLMLKAFGTANAEQIQKLGITGKEFVEKITAQMGGLARVQGGISNAIVNAGSAIKQFLAGVGEEINKVFNIGEKSDQFAKMLDGLAASFAGLSDGTKKFIVEAGLLLVVTGPILKVFGGIIGLGSQVAGAFKGIVSVASALGGGILRLVTGVRALGVAFSTVSVIALVAGAIALADAMGWFNREATQAEKLQSALNDLHADAEKSISSEKGAVNTLIGVLTSETTSRKAKAQALKELKAISPEYFGQLKIENGLVIGLSEAYQGYIANILLAAKAKKAESKLIELDEQKTQALKEQAAAQEEFNKLASEAPARRSTGFRNDASDASGLSNTSEIRKGELAQTINNAQKTVEAIQAQEGEYTKLAQAGFEANAKITAASEERQKREAAAANALAKNNADALDGTEKLTGKAKVLADVIEDVSNAVEKAKLLGDDVDIAKLEALRKGIEKLIDAGFKPASKEVQNLKAQLDSLTAKPNDVVINIIKKEGGNTIAPVTSTEGPGTASGIQNAGLVGAKAAEAAAAANAVTAAEKIKDAKIALAQQAEQAAFDIFSNLSEQKTERQLAALEAEGKARLAAAKGNAVLEAAIQADLDKKKAAIEKKAGNRRRLQALAEAAINTAVGITKAIPNVPLMLLAAAAGAIQVGVIASQKFAAGTRDAPGGLALVGERGPELVNLPRHSQVFNAGVTSTALRGGGQNVNISGEFRVRGTDLVLVLDRERAKSERFR